MEKPIAKPSSTVVNKIVEMANSNNGVPHYLRNKKMVYEMLKCALLNMSVPDIARHIGIRKSNLEKLLHSVGDTQRYFQKHFNRYKMSLSLVALDTLQKSIAEDPKMALKYMQTFHPEWKETKNVNIDKKSEHIHKIEGKINVTATLPVEERQKLIQDQMKKLGIQVLEKGEDGTYQPAGDKTGTDEA